LAVLNRQREPAVQNVVVCISGRVERTGVQVGPPTALAGEENPEVQY
jgi:hypothetical protein